MIPVFLDKSIKITKTFLLDINIEIPSNIIHIPYRLNFLEPSAQGPRSTSSRWRTYPFGIGSHQTKLKIKRPLKGVFLSLAAPLGLEPRLQEPESCVLPIRRQGNFLPKYNLKKFCPVRCIPPGQGNADHVIVKYSKTF